MNHLTNKIYHLLILLVIFLFGSSCKTLSFSGTDEYSSLASLPYLKNTPNECYFLDEFMPAPSNLVTGKTRGLDIRYYTYNSIKYKDIEASQVVLSFYSKDHRCWSLFEEQYKAK